MLFNFFKISVFSEVWVDMGILWLFGRFLHFLFSLLLHLSVEFAHLVVEYQPDYHAESIEKQNDDK